MKLRWSAESLQRTRSHHRVYRRDNPTAALELGEQILSSVEAVLPENPYSGRPGRVEGTRELVVHYSYIVAYEVTDAIYILTVRHSARLWPERL